MKLIQEIRALIRHRWSDGSFVEHDQAIPNIPNSREYPWITYEDYMEAQLIDIKDFQPGNIIVKFPPESSEDNDLHVHPISDRLITVIEGSGQFICLRNKRIQKYELLPGTSVWMPRGILHTFFAGEEGLLVQSFHNPFIPLNHPKCLTYLKNHNYEF
jgi:quercetin dioxygenase-like cupin family protein